MDLVETRDIALIKSILGHPEIYKRISNDDSLPVEKIELPVEANYIAGYVDGEIVGLAIYHYNEDRLNFHFQVLPEYRRKYAKQFARMSLDFGGAKNADVFAEIPECFPEVIRFALGVDFKRDGKTERGRKIGGIYHDVAILRRESGTNIRAEQHK